MCTGYDLIFISFTQFLLLSCFHFQVCKISPVEIFSEEINEFLDPKSSLFMLTNEWNYEGFMYALIDWGNKFVGTLPTNLWLTVPFAMLMVTSW